MTEIDVIDDRGVDNPLWSQIFVLECTTYNFDLWGFLGEKW